MGKPARPRFRRRSLRPDIRTVGCQSSVNAAWDGRTDQHLHRYSTARQLGSRICTELSKPRYMDVYWPGRNSETETIGRLVRCVRIQDLIDGLKDLWSETIG